MTVLSLPDSSACDDVPAPCANEASSDSTRSPAPLIDLARIGPVPEPLVEWPLQRADIERWMALKAASPRNACATLAEA